MVEQVTIVGVLRGGVESPARWPHPFHLCTPFFQVQSTPMSALRHLAVGADVHTARCAMLMWRRCHYDKALHMPCNMGFGRLHACAGLLFHGEGSIGTRFVHLCGRRHLKLFCAQSSFSRPPSQPQFPSTKATPWLTHRRTYVWVHT